MEAVKAIVQRIIPQYLEVRTILGPWGRTRPLRLAGWGKGDKEIRGSFAAPAALGAASASGECGVTGSRESPGRGVAGESIAWAGSRAR